jgi:adenosine kinase
MKNYLISGSFAYDSVLLHKGQFHTRILPESLARLNVAFGIDSHKDEFGGTGGNIAYNSALLNRFPILCGSVGKDFSIYESHLKSNGVKTEYLTVVEDDNTAHAWILTDEINNQITGFSKGAMRKMPRVDDCVFDDEVDVLHLAPDNLETTCELVKLALLYNKKYFFDPGQCLPAFLEMNNSELSLRKIISNATGLFVNEYESELLEESLGVKLSELLNDKLTFVVKTKGGNGVDLITKDEAVVKTQTVSVAKPVKIVDPTGCGDAFRAGFLNGYTKGWNLLESTQLGSVMGSFAIEESGGQNHKPTLGDISSRLERTFGNTKLTQETQNKFKRM